MGKTIGLIAGSGRLPHVILDEARRSGFRVAVCAIEGETDSSISAFGDISTWVRLGQLGRLMKFFKDQGVKEAVMAGKITKTNLLKGDIRPDFEMMKVLAKARNHSDDSLLGGIADHMSERGLRLLDSTAFLTEEALPGVGVLTKRKPTKGETLDIEFGWRLAKEMGRLDIGQTVVVKNQAILAVEAIEGTDQAILRGGILGSGGVTVVKIAKPRQDMRFDVPAVGPATLNALIQAKARVLAFEAKRTILIDRKEFVERAERHKIAVVAKENSI